MPLRGTVSLWRESIADNPAPLFSRLETSCSDDVGATSAGVKEAPSASGVISTSPWLWADCPKFGENPQIVRQAPRCIRQQGILQSSGLRCSPILLFKVPPGTLKQKRKLPTALSQIEQPDLSLRAGVFFLRSASLFCFLLSSLSSIWVPNPCGIPATTSPRRRRCRGCVRSRSRS